MTHKPYIEIDMEDGVIARMIIETGKTYFYRDSKPAVITSLSERQLNLLHQAYTELD